MTVIIGVCVLVIIFFIRSEYERKLLTVEEITINSNKVKEKKIFIFISDLHEWNHGNDNNKLFESINKMKPDFILIGGDSIISRLNGKVNMENSIKIIRKLAQNYPVYCADGNHESRLKWRKDLFGDYYDQYQEKLKEFGVIHLSDTRAMIGDGLRVTGIDLPASAYKKLFWKRKEEIPCNTLFANVGEADPAVFEILLAHSPLYFKEYRCWGADLTLSGHFHGGTIRLPVLGGVGVMTPQFQFFSPYCNGILAEQGKWMIVSRGIGTHSINIRINNKPQLVVVHLEK